ncbi:hypothetical protein FAY30_11995 [Bacillus sp. S3]|uniref:hypothetical protein n=1 Tax=Bacillus sp. S3 TaxID=486398 RepID=UPI001189A5ED|nr:hypothetical protein [Bacillus sp. S3]QCJ42572.1 hypothetical protein FAY30_11995 [Bacillus sp. S3]
MSEFETKKYSRKKQCIVDDCEEDVKAQQLCGKHYMRMRRRGLKHTNTAESGSVEHCLAVGCNKPHFTNGYCEHHNYVYNKLGYPHIPKVVKLCGVEDCLDKYFKKGLCELHFNEWQNNLKRHNLNEQIEKARISAN